MEHKNILIIGGGDLANAIKKEAISSNYNVSIIEHKNNNSNEMLQLLYDTLYVSKYITHFIITSGYLEKHANGSYTETSIEKIIDSNLTFPIKVINLILLFINNPKITVFSSSVTHNPNRKFYGVYSAAKAGLERFAIDCINNNGADIKIIRPSRINTKLRWSVYDKNDLTTLNLTEPNEAAICILNFLDEEYNILEFKKNNNEIICTKEKI